ncbi:MAG TPA: HhH-GPD-type base excision DNA repair protein [Streptosporangiaceae bacterium]
MTGTPLEDTMTLSLPIEPQANELLSRDGFALLLAMMLDQQVPFEKAFNSPYQLAVRLGHEPTAQEIADYDPDALAGIFAERPALHRFPRAMAARAQELARIVADTYDGDGSALWSTAKDGAELRRRLAELPGYGAYKAQITIALLGKQLGIQPEGWREAAGHFGEAGSHYSVADISDGSSLAAVRSYKKAQKQQQKERAAAR